MATNIGFTLYFAMFIVTNLWTGRTSELTRYLTTKPTIYHVCSYTLLTSKIIMLGTSFALTMPNLSLGGAY